jgi:hypothetical protein
MPAMRAILLLPFSALPLFVARVLANHPNHSTAADNLALFANFLH